MDLGKLITHDHVNITDLGSATLHGLDSRVVRSRERLFGELDGALRRHREAEEESLYDALEDDERTQRLIDELEDEHKNIEQRAHSSRPRPQQGQQGLDQSVREFHGPTRPALPPGGV